MTAMNSYFRRTIAWLSQGAHCLLLNGNPDMTVSSRCHVEYRLKNNTRWKFAHDTINRLFFWQHDHCRESFDEDVTYAQYITGLIRDAGNDL